MAALRLALLLSVYLAVLTTGPGPLPFARAAVFVTPGDDDNDGVAEEPTEVVFADATVSEDISGADRTGDSAMDIGRMVASRMTYEDILVVVCDRLPANVLGCNGVLDLT